MKYSRKIRIGTMCIVLTFLLYGCSSHKLEKIDFKHIVGAEDDTTVDVTKSYRLYLPEQMEELEKDNIQKICDLVKSFDYTTREYPIDTDIYSPEMDRIYKEAFLNLIFKKEPITYSGYKGGREVTYDAFCYDFAVDIGADWYISKGDFLGDMINLTKYWYLDFDGDGMPELIFELPGSSKKPQILKYDHEKECAYLYLMGDTYNWHFLSPGKLYYYNPTSAGVLRCGAKKYDSFGNETIKLSFTNYFCFDPAECYVQYHSEENPDNIIDIGADVDKETWNELTKTLFDAIDNKISSVTFDEVFGNMAYPYIN